MSLPGTKRTHEEFITELKGRIKQAGFTSCKQLAARLKSLGRKGTTLLRKTNTLRQQLTTTRSIRVDVLTEILAEIRWPVTIPELQGRYDLWLNERMPDEPPQTQSCVWTPAHAFDAEKTMVSLSDAPTGRVEGLFDYMHQGDFCCTLYGLEPPLEYDETPGPISEGVIRAVARGGAFLYLSPSDGYLRVLEHDGNRCRYTSLDYFNAYSEFRTRVAYELYHRSLRGECGFPHMATDVHAIEHAERYIGYFEIDDARHFDPGITYGVFGGPNHCSPERMRVSVRLGMDVMVYRNNPQLQQRASNFVLRQLIHNIPVEERKGRHYLEWTSLPDGKRYAPSVKRAELQVRLLNQVIGTLQQSGPVIEGQKIDQQATQLEEPQGPNYAV